MSLQEGIHKHSSTAPDFRGHLSSKTRIRLWSTTTIGTAILAVEKEAARLASMKTWTETIQSNRGKILEEVRNMADNLEKQIAVLRESTELLRKE
jgi:hypothetical protein